MYDPDIGVWIAGFVSGLGISTIIYVTFHLLADMAAEKG
jgi:hypothetical protein